MRLIAYTDGSALGNPGGPCSYGAWIMCPTDTRQWHIRGFIGPGYSFLAEYTAVVKAMEFALSVGATKLEVRTDCSTIVRHYYGESARNTTDGAIMYGKMRELSGRFEGFGVTHVPRKDNGRADRQASIAMERREVDYMEEICR